MRAIFSILVVFFVAISADAQRVTVTDEVNVRNDYAYDILGKIANNVLLYRNKGKDQVVNIYDDQMRFKREKDLQFEKRRVRIINITPQDSTINVIYQYREKDTTYLKLRKFDQNVIARDTAVLEKSNEKSIPRFFRFVNSQDKKKTAIFGLNNDDILHIKVINHEEGKLDWFTAIDLREMDFEEEFKKITISNDGLVMVLFEKNNYRFSKDEHYLTFIAIHQGEIAIKSIINAQGRVYPDLHLDYNNLNGKVLISGLAHDRKLNAVTDYFFINKNINLFQDIEEPKYLSFGMEFIAEIYGKKVGKEKELKDYFIKEVILRRDGGFVLMLEMDKDYSRRSAFSTPSNVQRDRSFFGPGRGWTDHYNEDVVVVAVKGNDLEHWRTILYKKQFSQDDGGVFSSFFVFKTPSRLKLIYNDEIKNNNTASEYILNPLGKYERNSLLSTDYQNLKLRFKDAVQVSNNTLLVPSEKGYNLRLVRIDYNI